ASAATSACSTPTTARARDWSPAPDSAWSATRGGGDDRAVARLGTATLDGRFEAFGRAHELVVGVSASRSSDDGRERAADPDAPAWGPLPPFPYPTSALPEPAWGEPVQYSALNQSLER